MGENGMTKYVINTVEIIKRVYLVDAYSDSEALDKNIERGPESADKVEVLGEMTYSLETINSYEYQKDWVDQASGRDKRHKSEWINAHEDGRAKNTPHGAGQELGTSGDKLKGPALNEIW